MKRGRLEEDVCGLSDIRGMEMVVVAHVLKGLKILELNTEKGTKDQYSGLILFYLLSNSDLPGS